MNTSIRTFVPVLLAAVLAPTVASATIDCSAPARAAKYASGEAYGLRLSTGTCGLPDACDDLDDLAVGLSSWAEFLQEAIPQAATPESACLLDGAVHGILAGLDQCYVTCGEQCSAFGSARGGVEAALYCPLAQAGGLSSDPWSRGYVGTCGLAYEMACDSAFIGGTTTCSEYTREPYAEKFLAYRLRVCDYANR